MDELPIGRRVAYWRGRRKMSQQVFADRLGKSKSWVDKVERGVRRLDKFSVVYEIADVLQLDVALLMGKDPERRPGTLNCIDQVEVEDIRAALERYDQISAFFYAPPEPPPLDQMRKSVGHAWLTYQHAKYGVLARTLPKLLRDAQAADTGFAGTDDSREAAHLLGQVYQIASSVLAQARRARTVLARRRPVDRGVAAGRRPAACRYARPTGSRSRCSRSAGRVRRWRSTSTSPTGWRPGTSAESVTPERLSVYGMLLLQGAMSAARIGDSSTVRDLLGGAAEAARALGGDANHYWTSFGPTNVRAAPGRGGRRARRGPRRGGHPRSPRSGARSPRCCRNGARTTTSTSPAGWPRSATSAGPARCCWKATGSRRRRSAAGRSPTRC